MGLALLSKYTAVLLGPAGLIFIFFDKHARKWLLRPEPYLAAVIALLIFSPVIMWNGSHEWASFKFQGAGRLTGRFDFDLPDMIGSILLLLTPTGLLTAGAVLWAKKALTTKFGKGPADETDRSYPDLLINRSIAPKKVIDRGSFQFQLISEYSMAETFKNFWPPKNHLFIGNSSVNKLRIGFITL
jgi:hypothetical protein